MIFSISQLKSDVKMQSEEFQGVKCSASVINESILLLSYEGFYPYGSKGNDIAHFMSNFAREAYSLYLPRAILFDLTCLEYEWGDAICGLVQAIVRERHELPLSIPTCVVARGETYEALKPLFDSIFLFHWAGSRLISERDEALAYLADALDGSSNAG